MSFQYIRLSRPAAFVAHVELNRPEKLNAFIPQLWAEMGAAFVQLSHDPEVRALVLSGAGDRAFTAGLDVMAAGEWMGSLMDGPPDAARRSVHIRRHITEMQACLTAIEECEKPVICVCHGISLGMAIDIACCADVRVCSANTRFAVKEVDIGLAADLGTLARLPKIVGAASWCREVCLTARDFGAEEAAAVGFVGRVLPTKQDAVTHALQLATLLASKSPVAVQSTKALLKHGQEHTVHDSLRFTALWNSAAIQCDDVQVALMSGIQKSKPRFSKL